MQTPLVSCLNVSKVFEQAIVPTRLLQDHILRGRIHRNHQRVVALDDVSLSVAAGEWIGICGPNGSGKTTLLRILSRLMQPDGGSVVTAGSLACFFELGVGFHPERNARENVRIHGLLHGMSDTDIAALTDEIIAFAGVESHRHLPLKCYSTGMRMRLAFAAATKIEADVYIIDEVIAVGDAEFQARCREYFQLLKQRGKTVILAAHALESLSQYCDRMYQLDHGRIVQE